jgi:hypothetical protein
MIADKLGIKIPKECPDCTKCPLNKENKEKLERFRDNAE